MMQKVYYIENTNLLDEALYLLTRMFPCFINRELIEMNCSEITVIARFEDMPYIEKALKPLT